MPSGQPMFLPSPITKDVYGFELKTRRMRTKGTLQKIIDQEMEITKPTFAESVSTVPTL